MTDTSPVSLAASLHGVLAALVTPFTRDGNLDLEALDVHIEFQLAHDTPAIAVCGSIGEYAALTLDERRLLAERAVKTAAGRTAVLVGVTHQRPPTTAALAHHAAQIGADGLLVSAPPLFKLADDELVAFWTWFDHAVDLPWVLYAAADATSGPPTLDVMSQVIDLAGLAGYKEPAADLGRLRDVLRLVGDRLPVIAAAEAVLPQALAAGAAACMTASACFAPHQLGQLSRAIAARGDDTVRRAFGPISAFRAHFQSRMDAGFPAYLPYTKAACDLAGLPAGPPRAPLQPVPDDERAALLATLQDHGLVAAGQPPTGRVRTGRETR